MPDSKNFIRVFASTKFVNFERPYKLLKVKVETSKFFINISNEW